MINKVIHPIQHHLDILNYKFDEMLCILDETFDHIKDQAPTVDAYESLSKKINIIFQKVFKRLNELNSNQLLASEVGPSHARGGEQKKVQWKPISDYTLRDEPTDEEILEVETPKVDDDEDLVEDVILGLQAIRERPTKVLSKVAKMKWSIVSCPSSFYETFQWSRYM